MGGWRGGGAEHAVLLMCVVHGHATQMQQSHAQHHQVWSCGVCVCVWWRTHLHVWSATFLSYLHIYHFHLVSAPPGWAHTTLAVASKVIPYTARNVSCEKFFCEILKIGIFAEMAVYFLYTYISPYDIHTHIHTLLERALQKTCQKRSVSSPAPVTTLSPSGDMA